jgi:hypothetical protein
LITVAHEERDKAFKKVNDTKRGGVCETISHLLSKNNHKLLEFMLTSENFRTWQRDNEIEIEARVQELERKWRDHQALGKDQQLENQ